MGLGLAGHNCKDLEIRNLPLHDIGFSLFHEVGASSVFIGGQNTTQRSPASSTQICASTNSGMKNVVPTAAPSNPRMYWTPGVAPTSAFCVPEF
jgi:hypothetical protein